MYEVVQDLMVKVQGIIKTFPTGSIVNLPEKSAQMFIRQGKIKPAAEEPLTGYELAERMAMGVAFILCKPAMLRQEIQIGQFFSKTGTIV